MTETDLTFFDAILERHLASVERRLTQVVNERTTNVIDQTTYIVGALQRDMEETEAVAQQAMEQVTHLRGHVRTLGARLEQVEDRHGISPADRQRPTVRKDLQRTTAQLYRLMMWSFVLGLVSDLVILVVALSVR